MGRNRKPIILFIALLAAISLLLAGCASDNAQAQAAPTGNEKECFQPPNPEEAQKLKEYAHSNGDEVKQYADGTDDVCIIENVNGQPQEHMMARSDFDNNHLDDFLMYSLLSGRGNILLGAGVLTGKIDPITAIILDHAMSVRPDGGMYHPYMRNNGGYAPVTNVTNIAYVKNVQYGRQKPISYDQSLKQQPPAAYQHTRTVPKLDGSKSATLTTDPKGKSIVTPNSTKNVGTAPVYKKPDNTQTTPKAMPTQKPQPTQKAAPKTQPKVKRSVRRK